MMGIRTPEAYRDGPKDYRADGRVSDDAAFLGFSPISHSSYTQLCSSEPKIHGRRKWS